MKRFSLAIALFCLAAALSADEIKLSASVKDGDKISGIVEVKVIATSNSTVNQVEFYVNGDLRFTDTSTPYVFTLDTIPEKEGPIKLEIGAYSASGDSKKLSLKLTIDNEVGKGAKFHVDNATKFLNVSRWDDAIQAARVALKADESSVAAKVVMARAYMGKGTLDKAQQWAEDATITDETVETTELLAGIHVERAFQVISKSGERGEALKEIASAFKAAVLQKLAAINMQIKALGPVTDSNRMALVDLHLRKHDYSAARRLLQEKWAEKDPDPAIGNPLIYATMRSGRMTEAYRLTTVLEKKGLANAVTYALIGAGHAYYRHWDEASEAIKNGGFDDADAPSIIAAAAYLALLKGDKAASTSQVARLLAQNTVSPAVPFYLSTLMFFTGQYAESRDYFRKTLVQDPLFYDAYVEKGYEALSIANAMPEGTEKDKPIILDQAKTFFEVALAVRPDAAEALNGLALTYIFQKNPSNALSTAKAAVGAGPEYPWAHFTLAAAFAASGDNRSATKEVDTSGKLDKRVLEGRGIPSGEEAWTYTYRYARLPVIILSK
jgi:tetratricopeptide (TPR) repeat protein